MHLFPVSPGSTLSNSLLIFPLLITKTTSFWGLLYNPNHIFSICLSFTLVFNSSRLFSPFPLQSFSSSPSLSFYHSVMPPFLSLSITPLFLSLYHTTSVHSSPVHCFFILSFFFFLFGFVLATLLGAWCLGGEKTWESKGIFWVC